MDELSARIEHTRTVLSHDELEILCFVLGLDYASFESDDSHEFAENLLSYLQETNQLEKLLHDKSLDESMSKEISSESIRLIQLHDVMLAYFDKEEVIRACINIRLTGWEQYEQLDDRDFYRELILFSNRRGYLPAIENIFIHTDPQPGLDSFLSSLKEEQPLDSQEKEGLILWMKGQASSNDLAHLAFLMGVAWDYNFTQPNKDVEIKTFVDYFDKRDRLYQVLAAKIHITGK